MRSYGLTEAGTWSAMSPVDPERDRRSVGTAAGCRFRAVAVEGETRRPLPAGEIGELEVLGPSVMLGYDRDPEATARVLRDGWLSTGDLGRVDERGRVFLAGRSKDLIIRAGANIYPADLIRHCRAQLSPYKCPETIRFVDAVPKTSRGKVSRAALQALLASVGSPSSPPARPS
jgi:acyl-CoA synthetase (AMP-forming)/AMP-acid ligase II